MKALNFLLSVSLLGLSFGTPVEVDDIIGLQNLELFYKFVEEIRSPPVIDPSEDLRADVLVTIRNGTLQGKAASTGALGTGKKYYAYTKVPYAKPPVGELRFEAPLPPEGWGDEIYNARQQTPGCAQWMTSITPASEDCLFLNIFTPRAANASGEPLPVMIFIHGGAFLFGEAAMYQPKKLMATPNDVVLIIVQYRLQAFGFMSTGDEALPGNMGLKDQVQALRWVQENIAAFGGDPSKVTIFGESAGAASSIYMLISPLSQGLFSKVIAQSGTALAEWAIDRNPIKNARLLAGQVGCPNTTTNAELVSCMKTKPWLDISKASVFNMMNDLARMRVELPGCSPVIEGNVPGAFLIDDPLTLLNEGPLPNVPVVLGAVQNEGSLPVGGFYFLTLERQGLIDDPVYMHDLLLGELTAAYGADDHHNGASLSQSVALAFMPDSDRENFDEMVYELIDLLSVTFMKAPILRTAEILSRRIPNNVYFYSFEHYGTTSLYTLLATAIPLIIPGHFPRIRPGIMHADDIAYQFPMPLIQSAADVNFGKTFCEMWTNFATHGTPTPEATARYPQWPVFDWHNQNYLQLKLDSEIKAGYAKTWRQGVPLK